MLVVFGSGQAPSGPPVGAQQTAVALARKYAPISLGLLVSLIWTMSFNRLGWRQAGRILTRGATYKTAGLVVSVMVYQHMLARTGAAEQIATELRV